MTEQEKRDFAEAQRIISRFMEKHPLEDQDFDSEGVLTEEATEKFRRIFERIMPQKPFRALEKQMFELQMNAVMSELVAIGALEYGPTQNGSQSYRRVRDWSDEEAQRAWARAEARLRITGKVREELSRWLRPI
jgi:hypothetical protein